MKNLLILIVVMISCTDLSAQVLKLGDLNSSFEELFDTTSSLWLKMDESFILSDNSTKIFTTYNDRIGSNDIISDLKYTPSKLQRRYGFITESFPNITLVVKDIFEVNESFKGLLQQLNDDKKLIKSDTTTNLWDEVEYEFSFSNETNIYIIKLRGERESTKIIILRKDRFPSF